MVPHRSRPPQAWPPPRVSGAVLALTLPLSLTMAMAGRAADGAGDGAAALASGGDVTVEQLLRSTTSWDGTPLPPLTADPPEVTVLRITIPPGVALPWHEHPLINAGVLVEGRMEVVSSRGQRTRLEAGDALIELVGTPHRGISLGPDPARIVVVYVGRPGQALSLPAAP